jgi:hypothetical protein
MRRAIGRHGGATGEEFDLHLACRLGDDEDADEIWRDNPKHGGAYQQGPGVDVRSDQGHQFSFTYDRW